jgi:hypothetical protein
MTSPIDSLALIFLRLADEIFRLFLAVQKLLDLFFFVQLATQKDFYGICDAGGVP